MLLQRFIIQVRIQQSQEVLLLLIQQALHLILLQLLLLHLILLDQRQLVEILHFLQLDQQPQRLQLVETQQSQEVLQQCTLQAQCLIQVDLQILLE